MLAMLKTRSQDSDKTNRAGHTADGKFLRQLELTMIYLITNLLFV